MTEIGRSQGKVEQEVGLQEYDSTRIRADILRSLLYYDIFSYPLTENELRQNSRLNDSLMIGGLEQELNEMVEIGWIFKHHDYYSVQDEPQMATRRISGNQLAAEYLEIAKKKARFIMGFPYVRAVYLSGSISKNYMPEDGDIDYFIIAESGRLWIARTLLILFKKVFLLNSHKFFCLNYFIDTNNLEIEEKNLFTATELVTLIPACDAQMYSSFRKANNWTAKRYPNFPEREILQQVPADKKGISSVMEGILNNRFGDWIDRKFMQMTLWKWRKKFGHIDPPDFDVALKSRPYVSKHHPQNFQRRVLEMFEERLTHFEQSKNIALKEKQE